MTVSRIIKGDINLKSIGIWNQRRFLWFAKFNLIGLYLPKPSASCKTWHKVNFKWTYAGLNFPSILTTVPKIKSPICPTICLLLEREYIDFCFSQVKHKQPCRGFELRSLISFSFPRLQIYHGLSQKWLFTANLGLHARRKFLLIYLSKLELIWLNQNQREESRRGSKLN